MEKNTNSSNSKFIIWMLMIFIMLIVVVQLCFSVNMYIITPEIIICLVLLVVLCLSDSFDTLSIPKLLTMSKRVKEVKDENNSLKEMNMKLISQIVSINNTNSQNIYLPNSYNTVGSSNINDVVNRKEDVGETEKIAEEIDSNNKISSVDEKVDIPIKRNRVSYLDRRKYESALRIFLLKKLLSEDIYNHDIQYNVKLIGNNVESNVMKTEVRFDALKTEGRNRIFYEIKTDILISTYMYRLHHKLSVIEKYKESNSCSVAKLCLIIPEIDEDLRKYINLSLHRVADLKRMILNSFEPAIENGLLEIISVDVTKKELDSYIKEHENEVQELS